MNSLDSSWDGSLWFYSSQFWDWEKFRIYAVQIVCLFILDITVLHLQGRVKAYELCIRIFPKKSQSMSRKRRFTRLPSLIICSTLRRHSSTTRWWSTERSSLGYDVLQSGSLRSNEKMQTTGWTSCVKNPRQISLMACWASSLSRSVLWNKGGFDCLWEGSPAILGVARNIMAWDVSCQSSA